ncbi:MAG: polysaccharide biosynthesis tyrosine autokinase [Verrucomicrobiota bacterium]
MNDPYLQNDSAGVGFDWNEFLRNLYYRAQLIIKQLWWIPLFTVSIGVAFSAYKSLQKPILFTSSAQMHVGPQIAVPEGRLYSEELSSFFGTQLEFMRSKRVLDAAYDRVKIERPHLPRSRVSISAQRKPDTSLFLLRAEGSDAEYTRVYLDAVLQEYMAFRSAMRSQTAQETYIRISGEIGRLESEISRREEAIVDFQRQNNVVFLEEQVSLASQFITELTSSRARLASELKSLESIPFRQRIEMLGDRLSTPGENPSETRSAFAEARSELSRLIAVREEFSIYLRPAHPKMIRMNDEIERMQNTVDILSKQSSERDEDRKAFLEIRIQNLEEEIAEWESASLDYSQRLAAFKKLESQLDLARKNFSRLSQSLESIDLNQNIQQEMVNVLEPASKASELKADLQKDMIRGGFIGIFVAFALWALVGYLDNRILSVDDLDKNFEHSVIGVIPKEQVKRSEPFDLLHQGLRRPMFEEAMRNLRSSLLFIDQGHIGSTFVRPKVFALTSAVPNEGKSTIASNLGVAMALARSKTLIIDADMRRGSLYEMFKVSKTDGLCELIQRSGKLEDYVQRTELEDLDILTTGQRIEQPSELFLDDWLSKIIEEARSIYQYIIIDTAPILATDDTMSLIRQIDMIVFAVRSSRTQLQQIRPAIEKLEQRRAKFAGFVLNFLDSKQPSYHYYKYYDYYSKEES